MRRHGSGGLEPAEIEQKSTVERRFRLVRRYAVLRSGSGIADGPEALAQQRFIEKYTSIDLRAGDADP